MTDITEKGQWVTIKGTHVFIRDGESVDAAIARQNEEKKTKDIAKNKEIADKLNGKSPSTYEEVRKYAQEHGDIWITRNMEKPFSPEEIKSMVDKVNEVYTAFGIDPKKNKLVYSLYAEPKLDDFMGKGAMQGTTLHLNPNSKALREENFVVIYHEVGHAIEEALLQARFHKTNTDVMARRLVKEANGYRTQRYPDSTDYISNYGLTNARELVAEAVRDYMEHGASAKPMSLAIVHRMKRHLDQTLNKG